MMRDYQDLEGEGAAPEAPPVQEGDEFDDNAMPLDPETGVGMEMMPLEEELEEEEFQNISGPMDRTGPGPYSVQDPDPGATSTHDLSRSREEAPRVPRTVPRGAGPPAEDMAAALAEAARDRKEMAQDPTYIPKAKAAAMGPSESRTSTPATQSMTRPERDFVRRHLPMELQDRYLKRLSGLDSLINKDAKVDYTDKPAFPVDSRVRATTCRTAYGIEPPHLRMALTRGAKAGARWTQMFRPGFNDIVNETFKAGCNACILSKLYLADAQAREQFQRLHVKDTHGTLWFELQRRKEYLFYQRIDSVDIMMWHPDAWGFPDTSLSVSALPGEPFDPMHGWLYQTEINTEKELDNVEFAYNLRMRLFPADTFQAIALGKVPA